MLESQVHHCPRCAAEASLEVLTYGYGLYTKNRRTLDPSLIHTVLSTLMTSY